MQQNAHHQLGKISKEHERITLHLEDEKRELEQREKELCKREADNEKERRMLHFEKQTNEKATLEKKQAEENVLNLAEDHNRETEKLLKKIVELEKTLEAKEAMELEIERMRETLHTIKQNLEEKEEELEGLEALNQVLIVKEHKSCQELQEARNELINASFLFSEGLIQ
ncbi:unnamed protein product [Ilex paraguariensis]|uniref:Uncharacterized protein n=1 Tax=Ilex paraguariensis TaxID=185542 RepID=A0ABC8RNG4_9AQUA